MINVELHALCLFLVILLYINMRNSCLRDGEKPRKSISAVYLLCGLVIISDCTWSVVEGMGNVNVLDGYLINIIYFISSSVAAACWYLFCTSHLDMVVSRDSKLRYLTLIPCACVCVLYLITPWNGWIFSISDGRYVRGMLFFLDPVIKLVYICSTIPLSIVFGKKKKQKYLKSKDFSLMLYCIPVVVAGILQIALGEDFNCLGFTVGLLLIYLTGVTNTDVENIETIYSLADSFEASYLVNIDTEEIKPFKDTLHSFEIPEMKSKDYDTHFRGVLGKILVPDDKETTLKAFEIENVVDRFKTEHTFTVRYRIKEGSEQPVLRMASFIHASGRDGSERFLLGINSIRPGRLLYERNEALIRENERLETINQNIMMSVAEIVEERDSDSGEHIIRVKQLSKILAEKVMVKYPEYGLDRNMVNLISSASVLHDVGKVVIPDAILLKPGKLTPEEFEIMKTHTVRGNEVLNRLPLGLDDAFLGYAAMICRSHHEKYDGKGYPDGLVGDNIPIAAQIVSVVDCYDALVSNRPYKKALPSDVAVKMILNGECGAFSEKMKDCFIASVKEFEKVIKEYK